MSFLFFVDIINNSFISDTVVY